MILCEISAINRRLIKCEKREIYNQDKHLTVWTTKNNFAGEQTHLYIGGGDDELRWQTFLARVFERAMLLYSEVSGRLGCFKLKLRQPQEAIYHYFCFILICARRPRKIQTDGDTFYGFSFPHTTRLNLMQWFSALRLFTSNTWNDRAIKLQICAPTSVGKFHRIIIKFHSKENLHSQ